MDFIPGIISIGIGHYITHEDEDEVSEELFAIETERYSICGFGTHLCGAGIDVRIETDDFNEIPGILNEVKEKIKPILLKHGEFI